MRRFILMRLAQTVKVSAGQNVALQLRTGYPTAGVLREAIRVEITPLNTASQAAVLHLSGHRIVVHQTRLRGLRHRVPARLRRVSNPCHAGFAGLPQWQNPPVNG